MDESDHDQELYNAMSTGSSPLVDQLDLAAQDDPDRQLRVNVVGHTTSVGKLVDFVHTQ